ncbi:MAG: hypothetical protein QMC04_07170 [Ilumatobacter sp.]|jgi:hypothetical protein|uniref:hypothetical protein n=1 Tax=uncultured Ilumatobacter sp. TaxID=879968 RepID=UPI0035909815|tara:strand:- start:171 stop:539 length:369 start_codon:yes stop_codon:yes gene_type:complete
MQTLQTLHTQLGWFLIVSNALVGCWSMAAQYVPILRRSGLWWAIGVAQISVFAAAIVGVLLVSRYELELEDFHALYGFTTIVAVGILYSYRTSPFIKDKQYALYGCGSLFIMGLGIRALFLR